jgi:hypothetical protein
MSHIYPDLINSIINKINASVIKPYAPVFLNRHRITALYDTGADICCMSSSIFCKHFPVGKRPTKLQRKSDVKAESGTKLVCEGIYPIPFTIDRRQFEHNVHVFSNLNKGMILGIDFLSKSRLGLDPLFWAFNPNMHMDKYSCPIMH